ncbi:MAG: heavy metal translocating P-type ATPase [Bryobacteraceae bacterium]
MPARETASFRIYGLDCAEEVSLLRKELSRHIGVTEISFDVLNSRMAVEFNPARTNTESILEAVARTGMRGENWQQQSGSPDGFWQRRGRAVAAAFSGLTFLAAALRQGLVSGDFLGLLLSHGSSEGALSTGTKALFLLAIVSGIWYSLPKAFRALRDRRADMNVLVAISITGAIVLGEWAEAATVAFLFSLANLMETWSLSRARRAIGSLPRMTPSEVSVRHGHHEHRVPVDCVPVGAIVTIKPGERIACDGDIVEGRSAINQALLTGESVPVLKQVGDKVYAGTINGEGALEVRTTRPASDTMLARVFRMVEDSQRRRAPMEQWVETFAQYYTPAVIGIAFLVAVVPPVLWQASWVDWFYQGMVVLLISCPCSLVISTPISILAALTAAARRGVLIKGGAFLEAAARMEVIAFDKTGVLTVGEPEVTALTPLNGYAMNSILARMAGLEQRSEHPVARAIVRHAQTLGIEIQPVAGLEALPGRGAQGELDGRHFWVGSGRLLGEKRLSSPEVERHLDGYLDAGQTVVACGTDDEVYALAALFDRPRPEAHESLERLKRLGIRKLVMLTGDNERAAAEVASQLVLDEVHANLLPEDKAAWIASALERYKVVAMAGDGINDTQAMSGASIGIALGAKGTDLALETADIVLMSDDLSQLPFLVRHSRRTLRVIQQNVAFSLATKAIFLALAMFGAATLWMAIAADMGATLLVTLNGLRMLRPSQE